MMDLFFQMEMGLPYELLRVALALLGTGAAAYFDITNRRNVPNWLLYGFLAVAFLVNFIPPWQTGVILYGAAAALFIFAVGYFFYRAGQIGGADIFVLAGLALLLPVQPLALLQKPALPFAFPFVLSVLLSSGFLLILYLLAVFVPRVFVGLSRGKVPFSLQKALPTLAMVLAYAVFLWVALQMPYFPAAYGIILALVMLALTFFMLFHDFITDEMVRWVALKEIEEEDVLALEKLPPEQVKKYSLKRVLDARELGRLAKEKVPLKQYPVMREMPMYLPFVLIGLVLCLVFGDLLFLFSGLV